MTKLLQSAIERVKHLPDIEQNEAAEALLAFAEMRAERYELTNDQLEEVEAAKAEVRAGKFASDREVEDAWRGFGL